MTTVTSTSAGAFAYFGGREMLMPRHRKPLDMHRKLPRSCPDDAIDVLVFLQSPTPKRWVARRKAAVVLAVRLGLVSIADACDRYTLSVDEFASWEAAYDGQGIAGLLFKATRRTERRRAPVSAPPMFGTFESGKSNHGLKSWNIGDNNQAAAEPD